ncbi:MAG TPA: 50S ribosomal protein L28 [Dictyoglomaceae bacterium]|nr:50S ribosomal protein L28 [Dictyoglomaceae bacterium]HOL39149.1 50S ribosomal protein L28 [Dictyoglomaceae bacterium]HOP94242.1 50S ribosomal protein L28 [Dictyoglomaceae bacterium]HPP15303.1 50S ribosomal protein L28 [Dictyoglomaceae bacterium]HPU42709.1 50S ribosomal protein L28 [Dictyoglomaceae bacterium]
MSRKCDICGKGPWVGFQVSHSHRRTKTRWLPNLHKVRAVVNGKVKTINVCTRCLKAEKVQKVV